MTTTSVHEGFPLPGATIDDKRLDDIVAIKTALIDIDDDLGTIKSQLTDKSSNDHVHAGATSSVGGFLSSVDKTKLDSLSVDGAPRATPSVAGTVFGRVEDGDSDQNAAIGFLALSQVFPGGCNTAFGNAALQECNDGWSNTAVGNLALVANTGGGSNTAVGNGALQENQAGSNNTAVGCSAGAVHAYGDNNTFIGYGAQGADTSSYNAITLGNGNIASLRCNATAISSLSDARDKIGITDIGLGLNFINTLRPVKYHWNRREWYIDGVNDGTKQLESFDYGFISQELDVAQQAAGAPDLNLVLKDNPNRLEATPGRLLPVLVKALQDASVLIEQQNLRITALELLIQK